MGGQAQRRGTARRRSARRWRRGSASRLVEAPGRVVFVLDEDRREARDHEQRRRDEAQQLAVSRAQHASSVPRRPGAATPGGSLPYGDVRAAGGLARVRSTRYEQTAAGDTAWMTSARPRSRGGCGSAFGVAALLIAALSGGATATVALNEVEKDRRKDLPRTRSRSPTRPDPAYTGGPQTYLILGSDRRAKSKDALDRTEPAAQRHDPARALRPRTGPDLGDVDPARPAGQHQKLQRRVLPAGKDQRRLHLRRQARRRQRLDGTGRGNDRERSLPGPGDQRDRRRQLRELHQDRRHARLRVRQRRPPLPAHQRRRRRKLYSEINLQPGYQKLCYNNALSYVRYRHGDSDFVRVARQQDFLRSLREQVSPTDLLGQVEHVAQSRRQGDRDSRLQLARPTA